MPINIPTNLLIEQLLYVIIHCLSSIKEIVNIFPLPLTGGRKRKKECKKKDTSRLLQDEEVPDNVVYSIRLGHSSKHYLYLVIS